MLYYFDSSMLVKRYAPEKGCETVKAIIEPDSENMVYTGQIGVVEIAAALSKKVMKKMLTIFRYNLPGFFVLANLLFAQPESPQNPNWTKYHSTTDAYTLLKGWMAAYPKLINLYSIGETLKGTPLLVLENTSKETGEADEKPGYYYEGNFHASELTGAEVAPYFAWYLLCNCAKDKRVARLVDTHTLYIRAKFTRSNPPRHLLKSKSVGCFSFDPDTNSDRVSTPCQSCITKSLETSSCSCGFCN